MSRHLAVLLSLSPKSISGLSLIVFAAAGKSQSCRSPLPTRSHLLPACHERHVLQLVRHLRLPEPLCLLQSSASAPRLRLKRPHPGLHVGLPPRPARQDKEQRGDVHSGKHRLQPGRPEPVAHDHSLEAERPLAAGLPPVRSHGECQTPDQHGFFLLHLPHHLLHLPDGGVWLWTPGEQQAVPGAAASVSSASRRSDGADSVATGHPCRSPGCCQPHLLLFH